MSIIISCVRHDDILSELIALKMGGKVAHAEALTQQNTYIGAFAEGGVRERPRDYDGGKFKIRVFIRLAVSDEMSAAFYRYLRSPEVMGEGYDYGGILGFVTFTDEHHKHEVFCSALMIDALRWIKYFPNPLPIPAHGVDPDHLYWGLMTHEDAKLLAVDDPELIAFTTNH